MARHAAAASGESSAGTGQQQHWTDTFAASPDMYGTEPSECGVFAAEQLATGGRVLELGAGQGRDTMYFARRGFNVVALDFARSAVDEIARKARAAGLADCLAVCRHDARTFLPFADEAFAAGYSHMLFCMALSTIELERLAAEVFRVVRPGGLVVYTVRTKDDAHYGVGARRGDDTFEQGGFVVHFFDRDLVDRLAAVGFDLLDITEFTEGALPRRLWRVTLRKPA